MTTPCYTAKFSKKKMALQIYTMVADIFFRASFDVMAPNGIIVAVHEPLVWKAARLSYSEVIPDCIVQLHDSWFYSWSKYRPLLPLDTVITIDCTMSGPGDIQVA